MSILARKYFYDEAAAFEYVESILWPEGPVCPHCGGMDKAYKLKGVRTKPSKKHPEGKERHGLYKCGHCRKQFTVRIGTIFEESHIPLHKWLQAIFLMCSSKKGISSYQLARVLEITVKSAWFLSHRIREAMRSGDLEPMGGEGSVVEVDETFIGNKKGMKPKGQKKGRGYAHKHAVLSLVERGGKVKSIHVDNIKAKTIIPIVKANVARETRIMTDEAGQYRNRLDDYAEHGVVAHNAGEFGRGDIHTNTIEGYFSIFKRGMKGIYQHCSEKHLHRYLAEFDFRYNHRAALGMNDEGRAEQALMAVRGKRLEYGGGSCKA